MDAQRLLKAQTAIAVVVLVLLWLLETWFPVFVDRPHRFRHATSRQRRFPVADAARSTQRAARPTDARAARYPAESMRPWTL